MYVLLAAQEAPPDSSVLKPTSLLMEPPKPNRSVEIPDVFGVILALE